MKKTVAALLVLLAGLSIAMPAAVVIGEGEACAVEISRDPTLEFGRQDCTTSSSTIVDANRVRSRLAIWTTSGSGQAYVTGDLTTGSTTAASAAVAGYNTGSFGGGSGFNFSPEGGAGLVYSGALRCITKSGTVTVFYEEE